MFEKSLYDLIRDLRNHKGNEREYIQHSLRECRLEIRGPDMDLKATALLKLIYLEMFGHDMSWASFHVLEVMSSQKYHQKRVGYLGAVQSFRPDTEVLMLATNLLKKDINSQFTSTMSLPLLTLPHIITSSLALSLVTDILPRLSYSKPSVRKKSVVVLYRLALVYPDTLRLAWPRIKDLLMDQDEDSSVTAAVINVVCELGWRRPWDFLPLAPRLFDLLVDGGNNWMAIKIIKLFATLTPLEPRLIKKLLPPLTTLIRTTPAMSLLYECINGIIQGGILEGTDGAIEGEEIASLCVAKLRGMIMIEGDPNLRYVALLAFNKILNSHAHVVSLHQDLIMSCIDDPDISIRLQALELGAGVIDSDNLVDVVERLMQQLRNAPISANNMSKPTVEIEPAADSEGEDPEEVLQTQKKNITDLPALPREYRIIIIQQILDMCSKHSYANISNFDWYIETLVKLVELVPYAGNSRWEPQHGKPHNVDAMKQSATEDIACAIGWELRNVAVRVSSVRKEAVNFASTLIDSHRVGVSLTKAGTGSASVLSFAAWVVGEFANSIRDMHETLNSLIHPKVKSLPEMIISAYLQAVPKVLVSIIMHDGFAWNKERKTMVTLLFARILHFLETFTAHPGLDIQERSVELAELVRVIAQAVTNDEQYDDDGPFLLTRVMPSLFEGFNLNPVAPTAQKKVPQPSQLNLDTPLNKNLPNLLEFVSSGFSADLDSEEFEQFYHQRDDQKGDSYGSLDMFSSAEKPSLSYQQTEFASIKLHQLGRRDEQRRNTNRDDPFYIRSEEFSSGASTPFHDIIRNSNGGDVDVDSIPIMKLDLGGNGIRENLSDLGVPKLKKKSLQTYVIADDEILDLDLSTVGQNGAGTGKTLQDTFQSMRKRDKVKKSLLEVDSSGLGNYTLDDHGPRMEPHDIKRQDAEDAELAKALQKVEHRRLEMQRAAERTFATDDIPPEGTLVKKRKLREKKRKRIRKIET